MHNPTTDRQDQTCEMQKVDFETVTETDAISKLLRRSRPRPPVGCCWLRDITLLMTARRPKGIGLW